MPLVPPTLDNRTFEQIVTEVRRRIPTFTPEWTDLNDGDPGITLAQLFAFMSEQLLFQVNQVPDKGLITFLCMVGAQLHPATPAVADVTFTPVGATGSSARLTFDLDARIQVQTAAPPPGQKAAITFETIRPFTVVNASLVDVVRSGWDVDYVSLKTANDSLTATFAPFDAAATTRDSFYLVLDLNVAVNSPPWPEGALRVRVNVAGSADVGEPEPPAAGSPQPPPRIAWSYSSGIATVSGIDTVQFTPIVPSLDSTLELTRSGYLELTFTANDVMKRAGAGVLPSNFQGRFVLRAQVLHPNAYGSSPPQLAAVLINTVTARSLVTVSNEPLGPSTGLPYQRFRLANAPVFPTSTAVSVDEATEGGGGVTQWKETLDIFTAGPNDRVYQLLPATGEILFGDGTFGKIPPPDDGSDAAGNITAASYQYGGGTPGNVGAATLTRVLSAGQAFDATNALAARGGDDEEAVALGVARAPAVIRSRYRAVSAADFEALAMETPGTRVARARALPNTRAGCRAGMSPGAVTVLLVPHELFQDTIGVPIDVPPHVAAAVLGYLDQRRLITTELFVSPATFRRVTIDASLDLAPGASLSATRSAAIDALNLYFHALAGGDDGLGWPFGGTIFFSQVFQRLLDVAGVLRVERLGIALDGAASVACTDVPIGPGELLFSGPHVVRVRVPA